MFYTFTHYCGFADRDNYDILKIQNFKRMLIDTQLIESNDGSLQLDLLFTKTCKNSSGIDF